MIFRFETTMKTLLLPIGKDARLGNRPNTLNNDQI